MGWLTRGGTRDDGKPSLVEAWEMLGARLGLRVSSDDARSVRAEGAVRGRAVSISIDGRQRGTELFQMMARTRRHRVHERWQCEVTVSCLNPHGLVGTVQSSVDANAPGWTPGNYDPRFGRSVQGDPAALHERVVSPSVHERLMGIIDDVTIEVTPTAVRLASEKKASLEGSWFVGVPIHVNYPNAPQPWPERALAGPVWWIDLLADIADSLDA